ncbi:MAG: hypothetical protein WBV11_07910 [Salegentibacter sp.]
MKKFAYILTFIFMAVIALPTIVALVDDKASIVFAIDEEEKSKEKIAFEFDLKELHSNYESIRFLKEQQDDLHQYLDNYRPVFLDVISPPPKQA